jgi:hypothetical protein
MNVRIVNVRIIMWIEREIPLLSHRELCTETYFAFALGKTENYMTYY